MFICLLSEKENNDEINFIYSVRAIKNEIFKEFYYTHIYKHAGICSEIMFIIHICKCNIHIANEKWGQLLLLMFHTQTKYILSAHYRFCVYFYVQCKYFVDILRNVCGIINLGSSKITFFYNSSNVIHVLLRLVTYSLVFP